MFIRVVKTKQGTDYTHFNCGGTIKIGPKDGEYVMWCSHCRSYVPFAKDGETTGIVMATMGDTYDINGNKISGNGHV